MEHVDFSIDIGIPKDGAITRYNCQSPSLFFQSDISTENKEHCIFTFSSPFQSIVSPLTINSMHVPCLFSVVLRKHGVYYSRSME